MTEDEHAELQKRVKLCHMDSMSELLRTMALKGIYLTFDEEEFGKIRRAYSGVANNINQITTRVNATGNLYEEDIEAIKKGVRERCFLIWGEFFLHR